MFVTSCLCILALEHLKLYLNQEGRGIGLANKMRAYSLQSRGLDTIDADHNIGFLDDERDFSVASKILSLLKIKNVNIVRPLCFSLSSGTIVITPTRTIFANNFVREFL